MKKKTASLILSLLLATVAGECAEPARDLFVSVLQEPNVLSSRSAITDLVSFSREKRIHTLFVQVYRGNQAWFPSTVADDGPYRWCVRETGEDPLRLLIKEAHEAGIEVHAWLNLLSLSANTEAPLLKKYGVGVLTKNQSYKRTLGEYRIDDQFFLEPSDPRVRRVLSSVVGEIVRAYPGLDGIQFDYIRYPDKDPFYGYSQMNMRRFHKAHPEAVISEDDPRWKEWRRGQVTALVKMLSKKARSARPRLQISTTGLMAYSRAFHEGFQDWKLWVASGFADFVTLMCYVPDTENFKKLVRDADENAGGLEKVNIAVGAYRFLDAPEVFQRQVEICRNAGGRGCVILDYGDLRRNPELLF